MGGMSEMGKDSNVENSVFLISFHDILNKSII